MPEFQTLVDKLNDKVLEGLEHSDLGRLSLEEEIEVLRRVRTEFEKANALPPEEIPTSVRNDFLNGSFGRTLDGLLGEMVAYGGPGTNPDEQRNRINTGVNNMWNLVLERIRPLLRVDERKVQDLLAVLQAQSDQLAEQLEEGSKQQAVLSETSGEVAATGLATFYKAQADSHAESAKTFFVAGGIAGVLLGLATWLILFKLAPEYTSDKTTEQWTEFIRDTIGHLVLLSLAAFALSFCVRAYRTNKHLEVLNKRRENALNTFGPLQGAVTGDDARNIIVSELVRAIFTSDETGYLSTQADRTVIESPGGAGLLTAISKGGGGGPQ